MEAGEDVSELVENMTSNNVRAYSTTHSLNERGDDVRHRADMIRYRLMERARERVDRYPGDVRAQFRDEEQRQSRIRAEYIRRLWQDTMDSRLERTVDRQARDGATSGQRQTRGALPPSLPQSRGTSVSLPRSSLHLWRATGPSTTSEMSFRTARDFDVGYMQGQSGNPSQPMHEENPYEDIKYVGEIRGDIMNKLKQFRNHSERAQCMVDQDHRVVYIAPPLPRPLHHIKWANECSIGMLNAELRQMDMADRIPWVDGLYRLDLHRYHKHLSLQEHPLLWQMPANIIAAARRVFVDGGTEQEIDMERMVSLNAKDERRMHEVHVTGVFTRGGRGTPEITPTWAFVWALKQGLLPQVARETFQDGFQILPAVVAGLIIERAHCFDTRTWKILLWRAIFSERLRREVEVDHIQRYGRLPEWTSAFSNRMWRTKVGNAQFRTFGFAEETRFDAVYDLYRRFNDARIAFRRTIRTWRADLFDRFAVDSMPSLNASDIPRKLNAERCGCVL